MQNCLRWLPLSIKSNIRWTLRVFHLDIMLRIDFFDSFLGIFASELDPTPAPACPDLSPLWPTVKVVVEFCSDLLGLSVPMESLKTKFFWGIRPYPFRLAVCTKISQKCCKCFLLSLQKLFFKLRCYRYIYIFLKSKRYLGAFVDISFVLMVVSA